MADIFNEVEEDLRRDRAKAAWKRYGGWVIGAVAAVVLGVGLHEGWQWWQANQRIERAQTFEIARTMVEEGDTASAVATLDGLAQGGAGFAVVARLEAARALLNAGDRAGAVAQYEALAADADIDALYRDLGTLMAVANAPGGDAADRIARLAPLMVETSPWRHSAREIAAGLALEMGDRDGALAYLRATAEDLSAPQAVRGRAAELLRALGQ